MAEVDLLMDLFWTMDKDGDGQLSKPEFCRMMIELGSSKSQASRLFAAIDKAGDGNISLQELVSARNAIYEAYAEADLSGTMEHASSSKLRRLLECVCGQLWR
eukprot:6385803-Prymnesium_polylepis.1